MHRVNECLREQIKQFENGFPMITLMMKPPSRDQVKAIESALTEAMKEAQQSVIHAALSPIVRACDSIDNSHTKSETVKAIRKDLDEAYEELQKLKASPPAPAAVDPPVGITTD